jgi:hypothetical protein
MESRTIELYKKWAEAASPEAIQFVDQVYALCEKNYDKGGDNIVECYTPVDVTQEFTSLDEVKTLCGIKIEQALNTRWGEDSDPEVERAERHKNWED